MGSESSWVSRSRTTLSRPGRLRPHLPACKNPRDFLPYSERLQCHQAPTQINPYPIPKRCPLRLGILGCVAQIEPGSEGFVLWESDLIDTTGDPCELEILPTDRLRSMFSPMPVMQDLYPVTVELVVYYRYTGIPGFVDVDANSKWLTELGITPH